jgi:hypothetical protein
MILPISASQVAGIYRHEPSAPIWKLFLRKFECTQKTGHHSGIEDQISIVEFSEVINNTLNII